MTLIDGPTPADLDPEPDDDEAAEPAEAPQEAPETPEAPDGADEPERPGDATGAPDAEALLPAPVFVEPPAVPEASEWERLCVMAVTLSEAKSTAPDKLKGKPADMLLVLLTARDLGLPVTDAMRGIYVVDGHVTLAPRLKHGLVNRKGLGRITSCQIDPRLEPPRCRLCGATESRCTEYTATAHAEVHATGELASFTFTWEDAQQARLTDDRCQPRSHVNQCRCKDNWKTYPQRMLLWRAKGYLTDDLFPEAAMGLYTPDELGAVTDADGHVIDVDSVEMPPGFTRGRRGGSDGPDERDNPADEKTLAVLGRRIAHLPEPAQGELREQWVQEVQVGEGADRKQPRLPPLKHLRVRHVKVADALVASVERRAKRGDWGPGWLALCPACSDDRHDQCAAKGDPPGPCGCGAWACPAGAGEHEPTDGAVIDTTATDGAEPEAAKGDDPVGTLLAAYDALGAEAREWVDAQAEAQNLTWRDAADHEAHLIAMRALIEGAPKPRPEPAVNPDDETRVRAVIAHLAPQSKPALVEALRARRLPTSGNLDALRRRLGEALLADPDWAPPQEPMI